MDVSIIIVNYNTIDLINECIKSIIEQTTNLDYEIIVSDNGSTDGSVEMLRKEFPQIVVVENHANIGFGAANNRGVEKACGKYVFLLNSDTILKNNAVKYLFEDCEKNKHTVVGSYLLDKNENIAVSYGTYSKFLRQLKRYIVLLYPFLAKKRKSGICIDRLGSPKKVEAIVGADLFVLREEYQRVNGFDEDFFMYFEDDDLCHRLNNAGNSLYIISGPKIVHLDGGSLKNRGMQFAIYQSSFFVYLKKYSPWKYVFYRFMYFFFLPFVFLTPQFSFLQKKEIISGYFTNRQYGDMYGKE